MQKRGLGTLAVILIVIGGIAVVTFIGGVMSPEPRLSAAQQDGIYANQQPWYCSFAIFTNSRRCASHLECINNQCRKVPGGGSNECNGPIGDPCFRECVGDSCDVMMAPSNATNVTDSCTNDNECIIPTHLECDNYQCAEVTGPGNDDCSPEGSACGCTDTDGGNYPLTYGCITFFNESGGNVSTVCDTCYSSIGLYERICVGGIGGVDAYNCASEYGPGSTCQSGECIPGNETNETETYLVCQNEQCVEVNGTGQDQCSVNADCTNVTNISGPDLIITDISFEGTTNMSNGTRNVSMRIWTKNTGDESTGGTSVTNLQVVQIPGISNGVFVPTLGPGATSTGLISLWPIPSGSTYSFRGTADINDQIDETSEGNNVRTEDFYIG
jgi:hypothetical protein